MPIQFRQLDKATAGLILLIYDEFHSDDQITVILVYEAC
jgi:hypothetical protein